jgi:hypothetical protein
MKLILIIVLNAGLIGLFIYLSKKKNLLSFMDGGKWWQCGNLPPFYPPFCLAGETVIVP